MTRFALTLLLATAACSGAADSPAPAARVDAVAWHYLGTWTGRGHKQTESFTSESGTLRARWETRNPEAGGGAFTLTIHSAISGRPLEQIVEHTGAGKGTAYLYEDPRVFHAVVDSHGLDWIVTVEEAVTGVVVPPGGGQAGAEAR